MISNKSRTKERISSVSVKKTNPALNEKMIMAFSLAEALKTVGLNYIFKGGTSVSLITQELLRFSTDIDIIVLPETRMEPFLELIIKQGIFTKYAEDIREGHRPGKHYKVSYPAIIPTKYPVDVLVDVLYADNFYPAIQKTPLVSPLLDQEGEPCSLMCPTLDCILGDKLTAVAIHTIGIEINSNRTLGILKQFFDIATLYDLSSKPADLFTTFENVSQFELGIKGLSSTAINEVADDIIFTAMMIGSRGESGTEEEFAQLAEQIVPLRSYIFQGSVSQDALILWASKAAYLATSYLSRRRDLIRYEGQDIRTLNITSPGLNQLKRIKKTSPESFYFFYKALELMGRV